MASVQPVIYEASFKRNRSFLFHVETQEAGKKKTIVNIIRKRKPLPNTRPFISRNCTVKRHISNYFVYTPYTRSYVSLKQKVHFLPDNAFSQYFLQRWAINSFVSPICESPIDINLISCNLIVDLI